MIFYPEERLAIFIDGANLYSAARGLAFDIDYKRLLELFSTKGRLIRAFYYTALVEDQEYSPIRPLVDWLDYNGYTMVTKPTKEFTDAMGRRRIKGNMDIELAIDMLEMAQHIDHAILFSGDGDFRRLVEAVQRKGVRVSVVSTIRSSPPMVSDDLRRQADNFIELQDLAPSIMRNHHVREDAQPRAHRSPSTRRDHSVPRRLSRRGTARSARVSRLSGRRSGIAHPEWFNAPVPSFGDDAAELLIVGLAPGLRGANRTGRPFTGDYAGGLLYADVAKIRLRRGRSTTPVRTTVSCCGACASPMRFVACRRKTSRNRARSRPAAVSWRPRSPRCPGSARSSRSAPSPIRRCSRRSACAAHASLSSMADCTTCRRADCSPTAITALGSTPIPASSPPRCSKRCSPR